MISFREMPDVIGHYHITKKLGEGGMGVVYAAEDPRLGRMVAIKMIHETTADPVARERLRREARTAASVNHPNVCQIYDVGDEQGEPYIVMELLEGEALSSRIERGPLALNEATQLMLEILGALETLHRGGLLHRDLKPSNVFLTRHGIKLLDFGLARWSQPLAMVEVEPGAGARAELSLTLPGSLLGTPRYMSPEQLRGETIDHRADIFAAGALLFEMLTGKPAFSGNSPLAIYHAVLYEQPAALAGSEAITAVNRVILKSLAKKRDDRYPAASAMADELRAVLLTPDAGAEVSARPMRRLIVLPFRLLKPDPAIDYLAFSLAEAVAGSLSGLESLLVRSTLAAASFAGEIPDLKRIAAEAEVDMVLTGTLLKTGEQLRATTQLVEAPAGTLLWSHTSQAPLRDVFALETALTQRVVESLSLPITEREQRLLKRDVPASPTAYEFYLRANQQGHGPQHWNVARDLLLRSVEEDPRYAPAWARLARCYWLIGKYTRDRDDNIKRAEEALQRALELNPDLAMAHNLYAHIESSSGRALDAMRRLIARARSRQSDPQVFAGLVIACRFCGLLEASVAAHEQARRLDPKVPTSVSQTFFMQGQYERALEDAHLDIGYADCLTLTMLGREQEALALIRKRKRDEDLGHVGAWLDSIHAFIEGRHEDCLAAIEQLEVGFHDPEGLFYVARTLAQIGKERHGLNLLRRSIEEGFHCFPVLVRDPWLDPLRTTEEFKQILLEAENHHRIAVAAFIEEGGDRMLGVSLAS